MNIALDESANGRTIDASAGDTVGIGLPETPSTGYRWQLVANGAPTCELVSDVFEAPPDGVPGRPGRHSWVFSVARGGDAPIELAARRRWEQAADAGTRFRIVVTSKA